MNYAKIRKYDISNAPGGGATLFVSGCTHGCEGCFNKEQQNFKYGKEFTEETKKEFISICKNENIKAINILGGEPMQQVKDNTLLDLLKSLNEEVGKPIWLWSGYTFEEIINNPERLALLKEVDVLIDGKYDESKRDLMLKYRGSSNHRIIDVKESPKNNEIALMQLC